MESYECDQTEKKNTMCVEFLIFREEAVTFDFSGAA